MAFWNTQRLKQECLCNTLITPYRDDRVLHCAYELGVGPEAFITSQSADTTHLPPGNKVTIPPGQFGLLITQEVVYVPVNAIAFISIRARIKFQGLVNVSGFHVDPGYRGPLKFAVYNAGSKNIVLDQDERIFMIWYADLDGPTSDPYPERAAIQSEISSNDVSKIQGEVASPAELKKQIDTLRFDIERRVHSVEHGQLLNRTLLLMLLAGVVTLVVTAFIKPYFEPSKHGPEPPNAGQPMDRPNTGIATPATDDKRVDVPSEHEPLSNTQR